jgi:DnaJ-class molecular chaperone
VSKAKDPYSVLGVSKQASAEEIKSAYRKLAKKYHPDTNQDDKTIEKKFKEITAAYNILSDTEKRSQYDAGAIDTEGNPTMASHFHGGGGSTGAGPFGGGGGGGGGFSDIFRGASGSSSKFSGEDIFSEIFGRKKKRKAQMPIKGANVTYRMSIPFLSAARGAKSKLKLTTGETIEVTIPKAIETGQKIKLTGKGKAGLYGGEAGDALVEITIKPHPYFKSEGLDIHLDLPITLHEALSQPKIKVPTIHGAVLLKIPENANSGQIIKIPNKGISKNGTKGNQLVKLLIKLPEKRDSELKDAIEKWYESHPDEQNIRDFDF